MKPSDVEAWAVRVVDSLRRSSFQEDSRVELKAEWVEASRAARRIAGHLNGAHGEDVLWLVGVDDSGATVEVDTEDFANWWAAVVSHFDGPVPTATEVVLEDDGRFMAIGLTGPQPPYVVKNPSFGKSGGGPVELEVPWREMTSTRTARHLDLVRILAPQARLPEIEILGGQLSGRGAYDPAVDQLRAVVPGASCRWELRLDLYCVPGDERPLVLPGHRTSVWARQAETFGELSLKPFKYGSESGDDRVLNGPGPIQILASAAVDHHRGVASGPAFVEVRVRPAWIPLTLVVECQLKLAGELWFQLEDSSVTWQNIP